MQARHRSLHLGAALWLGLGVLLALAADVPRGDESALVVTYLGNEGFLLQADGHKVLVDALVGDELPTYVDQSEELLGRLVRAEEPFDDVELVLATHMHADHFSADAVGKYLAANTRARFVSTPQAVARMRAELEGFEAIAERVRAVGPPDGKRERVKELGLDVLALHHGRDRQPPIENDAFVFELGGWKLLHMGDSECSAAELAAFELDEAGIDVAFVPSWYLDARPWKGAIASEVAPARVVVMHLAPDWSTEERTSNQRESRARVDRIVGEFQEAVVFEGELEERVFEREGDQGD